MLSITDLTSIARARLKDADVLLSRRGFDGAAYLCGYTVEIALKVRIAKTLKWPGFPETSREIEGLKSFLTHDLPLLLYLSGKEAKIKARLGIEWSDVNSWNPESRYRPPGLVSESRAKRMINSAKVVVGALL